MNVEQRNTEYRSLREWQVLAEYNGSNQLQRYYVYGVAVGTPVALRAPSVPTALTKGDESTLKQPVFCLDNHNLTQKARPKCFQIYPRILAGQLDR